MLKGIGALKTDWSIRARERLDSIACRIDMTIVEARHQMSS